MRDNKIGSVVQKNYLLKHDTAPGVLQTWAVSFYNSQSATECLADGIVTISCPHEAIIYLTSTFNDVHTLRF